MFTKYFVKFPAKFLKLALAIYTCIYRNLTKCHYNLTESHQISPYLTESCQISLNLTKSHHFSSNLTETDQISPNYTKCHYISSYIFSKNLIESHQLCQISLNLTKSHCISQNHNYQILSNLIESH